MPPTLPTFPRPTLTPMPMRSISVTATTALTTLTGSKGRRGEGQKQLMGRARGELTVVDGARVQPCSSDLFRRAPSDQLDAHFERLKRGDELGIHRPKSEARQKKDRQREMEKTAGAKWFDLPAFPRPSVGKASGTSRGKAKVGAPTNGPTAEEMTRQVQAIRLRNAMDPKQFYRGGNGAGDKGMPAFAQMGRIISSTLEPSSTLTRSERGRTVVDELVKDAQNAAYTKRKFGEVSAGR